MQISSHRQASLQRPLRFRADATGPNEGLARYAKLLAVAGELHALVQGKMTNPDIFRIKTNPRYAQMLLLDIMPWNHQVKEPLIMLMVENRPEPLAELHRILKALAGEGVAEKAGEVESTTPGETPIQTQ